MNGQGKQEHVVTGYVINFGNEDSKGATLAIKWYEEICPCQRNLIRTDVIDFSDIKGRSVTEIKQSFAFNINLQLKFADYEFTWQK